MSSLPLFTHWKPNLKPCLCVSGGLNGWRYLQENSLWALVAVYSLSMVALIKLTMQFRTNVYPRNASIIPSTSTDRAYSYFWSTTFWYSVLLLDSHICSLSTVSWADMISQKYCKDSLVRGTPVVARTDFSPWTRFRLFSDARSAQSSSFTIWSASRYLNTKPHCLLKT